jgi:hypothetical protein
MFEFIGIGLIIVLFFVVKILTEIRDSLRSLNERLYREFKH